MQLSNRSTLIALYERVVMPWSSRCGCKLVVYGVVMVWKCNGELIAWTVGTASKPSSDRSSCLHGEATIYLSAPLLHRHWQVRRNTLLCWTISSEGRLASFTCVRWHFRMR